VEYLLNCCYPLHSVREEHVSQITIACVMSIINEN
jgi:hypothetical protein